MGTRDPRVDAYIAKAAPFARPILAELRERVHAACPGVEETLKWSAPAFLHGGMLAGMAAFKRHCAFSFWKGSLIAGLDADAASAGMGDLGRITGLDGLPPREAFAAWVREAARLNEAGVKTPARRKSAPKPEIGMPAELAAALEANDPARAAFEGFSPSHRREYVEWIAEAKAEATRQRRLATALEWLAEGKPRNWKYMK
jgi:uncharacterized protein YdeI (YjbR/CyaY-like superfamily)